MSPDLVRYTVTLTDGRALDFEVDRGRVYGPDQDRMDHGLWTRLDKCFKERLQCVVTGDSNLNAMETLSTLSIGMQFSVEQNLEEFRQYF